MSWIKVSLKWTEYLNISNNCPSNFIRLVQGNNTTTKNWFTKMQPIFFSFSGLKCANKYAVWIITITKTQLRNHGDIFEIQSLHYLKFAHEWMNECEISIQFSFQRKKMFFFITVSLCVFLLEIECRRAIFGFHGWHWIHVNRNDCMFCFFSIVVPFFHFVVVYCIRKLKQRNWFINSVYRTHTHTHTLAL